MLEALGVPALHISRPLFPLQQGSCLSHNSNFFILLEQYQNITPAAHAAFDKSLVSGLPVLIAGSC